MEQMDEIVIPEIEEKPNKKRKLVWIAVAACVVVCIAAAVVFAGIYFNEEKALVQGVGNMVKEVQERQELAPENWPENRKAETKFNVSIEGIPVTLGIDTQLTRDGGAHRLQAAVALSVMNMKLAKLEVYGDDDTIVAAVPTIWEEHFAFDTKRVDEQYRGSIWEEKLGKIDNCPEVSIDLFEEKQDSSWEDMLLHCQEMLSELEIERLEEETALAFPEKDNIMYQCSKYRVVLPVSTIPEIKDAMGDASEDNMILLVWVDEDKRIVQIALDEPFSIAGGELTGTVSFVGEDRRIDDIIVNMQMESPVDVSQIDSSLLSEFGVEMSEYTVETKMKAEALYQEDDNSVTIDFDELTVSVASVGTVKIKGSLTMEPLQEEIAKPEENIIRLFEMTEDEYDMLEERLYRKMWSLF
ncbi:MAG: hypothetical protein NC231_08320 [Bacillus sp. (in: Bacteria)]|nr:hypothetical protein [Bacillus sp. (in: firmicutes)]MCM1426716.1 hypothetical protein [Eubacterium sp.]